MFRFVALVKGRVEPADLATVGTKQSCAQKETAAESLKPSTAVMK
jgi:hypothetical protein